MMTSRCRCASVLEHWCQTRCPNDVPTMPQRCPNDTRSVWLTARPFGARSVPGALRLSFSLAFALRQPLRH
eukprot:14147681-Alexandrium_andersonii.AAC.1